jgi:thiosulfate dehydrogenase [quinone] large subunit
MERSRHTYVEDPPIARALFSDVRFAWIWLVVRVYIGYQWLTSGFGKTSNPAWMDTGEALRTYWERAVAIPQQGRPLITYDWYRDFLNLLLNSGSHTWFSKLVVFGEIAIGIALIVGAFVGIAAFFGAFMNINFMLAGTTSTNPVLFLIAGLLLLAWKTAGYWGLDRYLLPALGTPWSTRQLGPKPAEAPRESQAAPSST